MLTLRVWSGIKRGKAWRRHGGLKPGGSTLAGYLRGLRRRGLGANRRSFHAHGDLSTYGLALPGHLPGEGLFLLAPVDAVLLEAKQVIPLLFEK